MIKRGQSTNNKRLRVNVQMIKKNEGQSEINKKMTL
jgi:hypothetical protein